MSLRAPAIRLAEHDLTHCFPSSGYPVSRWASLSARPCKIESHDLTMDFHQ
jgi:hypothetical protein